MDNLSVLKNAEDILSKEFEESVKFNGFIIVNDKLQIRFKFVKKDTQYLPFSVTWEDLEELKVNKL